MPLAGTMLEMMVTLSVTVLAFVVLLSLIVFFHEYGHFKVARMLGVKVDVFSIGMGRAICKWTDKKGTEWRISWLPLGGYVKFFGDANIASAGPSGEAEQPVTTQFPKRGDAEAAASTMTAEERAVCFHFKPAWRRAAIVAAGPIANFILAIAIFAVLFMSFGQLLRQPLVAGVAPDSPAAEAGFEPGDRFVKVDGKRVYDFSEVSDAVLVSGGSPLRFELDRNGETIALSAAPKRVESKDSFGNPITIWQLGIRGPSEATFQKYGPLGAVGAGVHELRRILTLTVQFIGKIILGKEDARQLGGPIKMAQYAGQSVMSGFDDSVYREPPGLLFKLRASLVSFISLAAVVSVSIGFLNLLPIPVLDGGHLMYYAYEAVAGRPLGARTQAIGFRVGIVLLASLMIFVTWNDINNLLSSIS